HTLQFKYGFRSEISLYYRSGVTTGPTRTDQRYGMDLAAEKKVFGERGMVKLAVNGLLRNANPQLTSEYGDLKIFHSDFPDNRQVLLSLNYRFGNYCFACLSTVVFQFSFIGGLMLFDFGWHLRVLDVLVLFEFIQYNLRY